MMVRGWILLSAALVAGTAMAVPAPGTRALAGPVVVPFELTPAGATVRIKVGGVERRMVLATDSPYSYVRSAPDGVTEAEAGGLRLGKVRFAEPPEALAASIDGAIGRDLLQGMAVGFDEFNHAYALWPRGATPTPQEAESWTTGLPAWGGPSKPRRIKMGSVPGGAPCLDLSVGNGHAQAIVSVGDIDTNVAPSVMAADADLPRDRALFSRPTLGGLSVPWLRCRRNELAADVRAVVAVYALASRRTLVDFSKNALYVEELPEDARLSKFLMTFTRASVEVRDDGLVLQVPPGADPARESVLIPFQGMAVVRIAGVSAKEWVNALRGKGDVGAKTLATLLAKLYTGFSIEVQAPDGLRTINVPGN